MRDIKYRGRRLSDGEWMIGNLVTETDGHLKIQRTFIHLRLSPIGFNGDSLTSSLVLHEVDPETVGEYTGLKDKNGKEIYEGDIIHVPSDEYEPEYKGDIKWYEGYWGFDEFYPDGTLCGSLFLFSYHEDCEIIGNIYESAELLGKEDEE